MRRIGGVVWKRSSLLLVALCVCVGLAALAVQAMGSFGKPKGFAVGASPSAIAIGDLNGDGRRDIAVANYRSDNVSILLGKGGGSFGKKRNFSVGSRPRSLAIGKLNGDATPDIAVADGTGVSVLLGKGDGTFAPAKDYAAGKYPSSVAIGDFDGNGSRDLAVVVSTGVSILLGRGDGTFGPAQLYPTGINPVTVVVGNFDADANLDLAVSNAGAVDCEGRVGRRAQASSCTGGFGTVSVLRGRGDGSFGPTTEFPVGRETAPTAMVVGDFNADRKPDLALVDSMQYSLGGSILLGNGAGGFGKASSFTAGHEPVALAVGDFNQDSRQDLAVISREDPKGLLILRGRGNGSFGPPAEVSHGPRQPRCGQRSCGRQSERRPESRPRRRHRHVAAGGQQGRRPAERESKPAQPDPRLRPQQAPVHRQALLRRPRLCQGPAGQGAASAAGQGPGGGRRDHRQVRGLLNSEEGGAGRLLCACEALVGLPRRDLEGPQHSIADALPVESRSRAKRPGRALPARRPVAAPTASRSCCRRSPARGRRGGCRS